MAARTPDGLLADELERRIVPHLRYLVQRLDDYVSADDLSARQLWRALMKAAGDPQSGLRLPEDLPSRGEVVIHAISDVRRREASGGSGDATRDVVKAWLLDEAAYVSKTLETVPRVWTGWHVRYRQPVWYAIWYVASVLIGASGLALSGHPWSPAFVAGLLGYLSAILTVVDRFRPWIRSRSSRL